ncbi:MULTISPECIES: GGDEF domain-containing protein [Rhodanobacter]|uniref:diguanylate cyclase n=1 Tax=Rhodanobacter hydrolyticus TaxID=2250595 RepID=A0ABW8J8T9_9GAMM|nr:GGDEF domain-containing protein [Rhodanobacter sp. 7MK24]MBD8881514.1 GGDEF domain-containing protein [Rhodanobacter sp. 7MK24]
MDTTQPSTNPHDKVEVLKLREAQWRHVGGLLHRLLAQLAGSGDLHNHVLESTLAELRGLMREPGGDNRIATLLGTLAKAVKSPDAAFRPEPDAAPTAANELLLAVLDYLALEEPAADLAELRQQVAGCTDAQALCEHGKTLAALVNRRLKQLSEERRAAAQLLHHVNCHLGSLTEYLDQDESANHAAVTARHELNGRMLDEVQALDEYASAAPDLASLRHDVQARLATIRDHLASARDREAEREQDWQKRLKRSRHRVRQLEDDIERMETMLAAKGHLVDTDALTGLANRRALEVRMPNLCDTPIGTTSLLMADIDHFKEINDRLGHGAGDRALRIVAEQLVAALRPGDFLARYGGEEFVAILEAGPEEAILVAERLRERIERTRFRSQDQPVHVTLSCGVTTTRAGDTPESVFERADRALYQAKRAGRNRCMVL